MAKSNKKVLSVLNKKKLSIPEKKKLSTPEDDQLSIEIVKAFQKQALPISKQISSLRIDSQHDYELAEELLSKLKTMSKKAVKERKSMTGPLKQVIKKIEKHFKPFIDSIALIEKDTKAKMIEFIKENKREAKQIEVKFESGEMKPAKYVQSIKKLEVATTLSTIRTIQKVKIMVRSKIPARYMEPNLKMIEDALKAGRKVPGCKLVEEPNIAI
jgi:DNA-binding protein H-NS